jgi:serine/threonine protein kinase
MAFALGLSIRKPAPPSPMRISKNIEYKSPTLSESPPGSPTKIKTLDRKRRTSAIILKELNENNIILEHYLAPLLSQKFDGSYIVQTFPMIGNDLTQIDRDTYRENRTTIQKTLLEAVSFLHSRGIIHRDIKPDNVVWDGARSRLIDFDNIVRIGSARNNFGGTIPRLNSSTRFTTDYDLYCAKVTIQALDVCYYPEKIEEFWPDGVEDYAKSLCHPAVNAKGGARMRSMRTTKRRSYKKNGRLRAGQSRRRNYTRHVARQL